MMQNSEICFVERRSNERGRDRFVRNVLIAIGNSGDAKLRSNAEALTEDPSPLVAAAAMRALDKLSED